METTNINLPVEILTLDKLSESIKILNSLREEENARFLEAIKLVATIMDKVGYSVIKNEKLSRNKKPVFYCFPNNLI